jgi:hypothetical protein
LADGNESHNIILRCLSSTNGVKTATLSVAHSAAGSPVEYLLTCTVIMLGYASDPAPGSALILGVTTLGRALNANIIVINTGVGRLDVTDAIITGTDAADFQFNGGSPPFSIASGSTNQTMTIQCLSKTQGYKAATLTILHSADGSPIVYTLTCLVNLHIYYFPFIATH